MFSKWRVTLKKAKHWSPRHAIEWQKYKLAKRSLIKHYVYLECRSVGRPNFLVRAMHFTAFCFPPIWKPGDARLRHSWAGSQNTFLGFFVCTENTHWLSVHLGGGGNILTGRGFEQNAMKVWLPLADHVRLVRHRRRHRAPPALKCFINTTM